MDLILEILKEICIAGFVGMGWAYLFNCNNRSLWVVWVLGGLGFSLRFLLLTFGVGLISSTLIACVSIGISGVFFAHIVNVPPVVFTMPACITMIPGKNAYRTLLGCIKMADFDYAKKDPSLLIYICHNFIITMALLFSLAIGISVGVLLFRNESSKYIYLKPKLFMRKKSTKN